MPRRIAARLALATLILAASAAPAHAKHAWGDWHWERASNPITLKVLDSTTDARTPIGGQNWPAMLTKSATDWSQSSVLDLAVQPQTAADLAVREACPFAPDAIRVCNVVSPDVTWLGLAVVAPDFTSGSGHLLSAVAIMNDTWFTTPLYNATNAQHVMCQEVGHTLGLGHQSEDGTDLNTCMDYADALDNPSPNAHDYQQLDAIYAHLDGTSSGGGGGGKPSKGGGSGGGGGGKNSSKVDGFSPAVPDFPAGYHGTGDHGGPHSDVFVVEQDGRTLVFNVLWAY